jgi:hypothetical protein
MDNSVRWRIQPAATDELFLDYREFDNVRDNLVTRELKVALNQVFADFGRWPRRTPTAPTCRRWVTRSPRRCGRRSADRSRSSM